MKSRYALISLYDKKNLRYLCKNLCLNNYKFIATGSTCKHIKGLGYNCLEISKITKFKEILGGRVKTIDSKIFSSILFNRNKTEDIKDFQKLRIPQIDLVVINFYPFKNFSRLNNERKIIEMIDIGGPSLVRAASKNYSFITTVCDKNDYKKLIDNLRKNNGFTDIIFRKNMAKKSFRTTYEYDYLIYNWLNKNNKYSNKKNLRYGENPGQKSYLVSKNKLIDHYKLNGKEVSYNNILDIDSGYNCLQEFNEPTCIIIKHTNPCGVSSSKNIKDAYVKAYNADPKSAYGGVVLLNRKIDKNLASLISKKFFEIIVATGFNKDALSILTINKKLILLKLNKVSINKKDIKSTIFGEIHQHKNNEKISIKSLNFVSNKRSSRKQIEDLIFSLKVVKHLKSNAIVISRNKQTLGIGVGQTNRYDSVKLAINNMKDKLIKSNFVCASDGFFPFVDSLQLLKKNNCNSVCQPQGSINDKKNVEYAIKNNISLYFTNKRLFKH